MTFTGPCAEPPPANRVAYVGVVPLMLAFVGVFAARRAGDVGPWRLMRAVVAGAGDHAGLVARRFCGLLQLPGLGWFRAPARYTLLTSLGLAPAGRPGAG